MNNFIVYYYSHSGNNAFIAKKIAKDLKCNYEEIIPIPSSFFLLILMTFIGIGSKVKKLKHNPSEFKTVIICSPIWIGQLVAPMRGFINKYKNSVDKIIYLTFCGSNEEDNKTGFGFEKVHKNAVKVSKGKIKLTKALSIKTLRRNGKPIPEEEQMNINMNDDLFTGEFKKQYDEFMEEIKKNWLVVN